MRTIALSELEMLTPPERATALLIASPGNRAGEHHRLVAELERLARFEIVRTKVEVRADGRLAQLAALRQRRTLLRTWAVHALRVLRKQRAVAIGCGLHAGRVGRAASIRHQAISARGAGRVAK